MSFTLILDTSTSQVLVAFAEGKRCLLKQCLPGGKSSSYFLMKTIEDGFKQLSISSFDLKAIAVAQGPGSYTGLRVGAAAAKGLAFPRGLPLVGFGSLEGYIAQQEGPFAALIDARIGGHYVLLQECIKGTIRSLSQPQLIPNEHLDSFLQNYPVRVGPHTGYPDGDHLASIVENKLENGIFSRDLELFYLRTPEYQKDNLFLQN